MIGTSVGSSVIEFSFITFPLLSYSQRGFHKVLSLLASIVTIDRLSLFFCSVIVTSHRISIGGISIGIERVFHRTSVTV